MNSKITFRRSCNGHKFDDELFDPKELELGIKWEKMNSKITLNNAKRIAKDNLFNRPDYYTWLHKMEKKYNSKFSPYMVATYSPNIKQKIYYHIVESSTYLKFNKLIFPFGSRMFDHKGDAYAYLELARKVMNNIERISKKY